MWGQKRLKQTKERYPVSFILEISAHERLRLDIVWQKSKHRRPSTFYYIYD